MKRVAPPPSLVTNKNGNSHDSSERGNHSNLLDTNPNTLRRTEEASRYEVNLLKSISIDHSRVDDDFTEDEISSEVNQKLELC